ncbi:MAG TPA: MinD/ParA family protein, partial [Candidatus Kapabacteria bacterium]|nr:MinD/ParA family protein [Candidatus Kapabacteria bacterium]
DLIKKTSYDYIIFDTPAGLNNINVELALISDLNCLVITDEPTSLLDGYALIKVLREYMDIDKIKLVVNNTIDYDDGSDIATKMNLATEKFLGFKAEVLE